MQIYLREAKVYCPSRIAKELLSQTAHLIQGHYFELEDTASPNWKERPFILQCTHQLPRLAKKDVKLYFSRLAMDQGMDLKLDFPEKSPIWWTNMPLHIYCLKKEDCNYLLKNPQFVEYCQLNMRLIAKEPMQRSSEQPSLPIRQQLSKNTHPTQILYSNEHDQSTAISQSKQLIHQAQDLSVYPQKREQNMKYVTTTSGLTKLMQPEIVQSNQATRPHEGSNASKLIYSNKRPQSSTNYNNTQNYTGTTGMVSQIGQPHLMNQTHNQEFRSTLQQKQVPRLKGGTDQQWSERDASLSSSSFSNKKVATSLLNQGWAEQTDHASGFSRAGENGIDFSSTDSQHRPDGYWEPTVDDWQRSTANNFTTHSKAAVHQPHHGSLYYNNNNSQEVQTGYDSPNMMNSLYSEPRKLVLDGESMHQPSEQSWRRAQDNQGSQVDQDSNSILPYSYAQGHNPAQQGKQTPYSQGANFYDMKGPSVQSYSESVASSPFPRATQPNPSNKVLSGFEGYGDEQHQWLSVDADRFQNQIGVSNGVPRWNQQPHAVPEKQMHYMGKSMPVQKFNFLPVNSLRLCYPAAKLESPQFMLRVDELASKLKLRQHNLFSTCSASADFLPDELFGHQTDYLPKYLVHPSRSAETSKDPSDPSKQFRNYFNMRLHSLYGDVTKTLKYSSGSEVRDTLKGGFKVSPPNYPCDRKIRNYLAAPGLEFGLELDSFDGSSQYRRSHNHDYCPWKPVSSGIHDLIVGFLGKAALKALPADTPMEDKSFAIWQAEDNFNRLSDFKKNVLDKESVGGGSSKKASNRISLLQNVGDEDNMGFEDKTYKVQYNFLSSGLSMQQSQLTTGKKGKTKNQGHYSIPEAETGSQACLSNQANRVSTSTYNMREDLPPGTLYQPMQKHTSYMG